MKKQFICCSLPICLLLALPGWGFEIRETETEARIVPPDPITPAVELSFSAQLFDVSADLSMTAVGISWENAGGITPCINVIIPQGCFVNRNRSFYVEDYSACRVQVWFDADGTAAESLALQRFRAKLQVRGNRSAYLDLDMAFHPQGANPPDDQHAILGVLGGAKVGIAIGGDSGISQVESIKSKSGIQPTPF